MTLPHPDKCFSVGVWRERERESQSTQCSPFEILIYACMHKHGRMTLIGMKMKNSDSINDLESINHFIYDYPSKS